MKDLSGFCAAVEKESGQLTTYEVLLVTIAALFLVMYAFDAYVAWSAIHRVVKTQTQ
jgi:hypothetical protein